MVVVVVVAGLSSTLVAPTLKLTRLASLTRFGSSSWKLDRFGGSTFGGCSKIAAGRMERAEGCCCCGGGGGGC